MIKDLLFSYLNKLADEYNTNHHSNNKNPINADYSTLTEKLRPVLKLLNLKLITELELLSIKIVLVTMSHWKLVKRNIYYWFGFEN